MLHCAAGPYDRYREEPGASRERKATGQLPPELAWDTQSAKNRAGKTLAKELT